MCPDKADATEIIIQSLQAGSKRRRVSDQTSEAAHFVMSVSGKVHDCYMRIKEKDTTINTLVSVLDEQRPFVLLFQHLSNYSPCQLGCKQLSL